jgi:hypothetical protein
MGEPSKYKDNVGITVGSVSFSGHRPYAGVNEYGG